MTLGRTAATQVSVHLFLTFSAVAQSYHEAVRARQGRYSSTGSVGTLYLSYQPPQRTSQPSMSLTALTDSRVPFGVSPAWQGLNDDLPAKLHDLHVLVQPTQT